MGLSEAQRREWDEITRLLRNYTNQEAYSTQLHLAVADHLEACERVVEAAREVMRNTDYEDEMPWTDALAAALRDLDGQPAQQAGE
jgi:plasmid stability protein